VTIRRLIVPLAAIAALASVSHAGAQGAFPAPLPGVAQGNASPFPPVNGAPAAAKPSPFPPVNQAAPAQSPFPPVGGGQASPFPPAGGGQANSSAFTSGAPPLSSGGFSAPAQPPQQQAGGDKCMQEFQPLRKEAERRGELIKKASERGAPPSEACKLIGNYAQSEVRMIKYVDANAEACGIPDEIKQQLRNSNKNTEQLRKRVCQAAAQMQQRRPAGPSLSDVLGSSASAPQPTATKRGGAFDTLTGNALQR